MNPKNVAFTSLANLDNPKIAERNAIENLVVTKNCVNTHTHTHTHILIAYTSRVNAL